MEELIIRPKVSIITINLNDEIGLDETICSIKAQTFINYELIVIDGGSLQNSVNVIKKHANSIAYWVSESDKGIYNAMNKGILQSKGEYCFFLNSGDRFVSNSVLGKVFENQLDSDIVYGNLIVCDRNKKIIGKCIGKEKLTFMDIYVSTIKHQASFIKRRLFDKYGLYDENLKIIADWAFFLKSIGLGEATVEYLDIDISFFDDNGISNKSSEICAKERKQILETYLPLRIREDYEHYFVYFPYDKIIKHKSFLFFLRVLNKCIKMTKGILKPKKLFLFNG